MKIQPISTYRPPFKGELKKKHIAMIFTGTFLATTALMMGRGLYKYRKLNVVG